MRNILVLSLLFTASASLTQAKLNEQQKENFFEFLHSHGEGREFLSTITNHIMDSVNPMLSFAHSIKRTASKSNSLGSFIECQTCKASVYALDSSIRSKTITKALEQFGVLVCDQIETANNTVCPGVVAEMGDVIVPTLANFLLSPDYLCSRVLNYCGNEFVELSQDDYVKRVLSDKPDIIKNNDYVHQLYQSIKGQSGRKTFKAVHYSDVHVDLYYKPGTNAKCNMPLCCREENGIPANPADAAGPWGDYNCDTTPATLTKMFEFVRDEIKPDVLFWTGDMSAHSVWENSDEEVANVNTVIANQMHEMFGDSLVVYPLQGNHDVFPVNVQSFTEPNYLVQNLTQLWSYWLHNDTLKTFSKAGYYAQYFEIKNQNKLFDKVRVLGVTTQTCNEQNWYLWEVLADPGDELSWLEGVLKDMEAKGEIAILLGHIPINGCLRAWGSRFQALMDRYQHIVRFGLFGHSHDEKFFLSRSVNVNGNFTESKPIAFNSILAPTTTYQNKNPSFAVYEIDEELMIITNITTYFFNITKANLGNPEWEVYHNILEDYQIEDLSPVSVHDYALRIFNNETEAMKFNMWNAKNGPDGYMASCDQNCRRGMYCDLATSYTDDEADCNEGKYSEKSGLKDRDSQKAFGINKMQKLMFFSEDQFYEFMADPWLQKV